MEKRMRGSARWKRGCGRWGLEGGLLGILLSLLALGGVVADGATKTDARPGAQANPAAGKAVYERLCSVCHGPDGKGDGQAMRGMPVRAKSFADPAAMRGLADQGLFDAIKKGGAGVGKSPMMPPFGDQLKDPQIWDLVAYIRSLAARRS
jgi:mono/diheme cytochrome c family protein